MTVEDLPAVFALRVITRENRVTMQDLVDYGITPESLADAMTSSVKGWVYEDDGKVVGFAMADQASGEVLVVAVLPEYEGLGVGSAVLKAVGDWLFAAGLEEIWLYTTAEPELRACGFYTHLGWEATGEREDDEEMFVLRRATS